MHQEGAAFRFLLGLLFHPGLIKVLADTAGVHCYHCLLALDSSSLFGEQDEGEHSRSHGGVNIEPALGVEPHLRRMVRIEDPVGLQVKRCFDRYPHEPSFGSPGFPETLVGVGAHGATAAHEDGSDEQGRDGGQCMVIDLGNQHDPTPISSFFTPFPENRVR
jgi:hypothetical protein